MGMHSLRLERMPRRYTNYSFLITSMNKVIGLFLILTLCSTVLMLISLKTFFGNFLPHSDTFLSPQETVTRYPVKWHSFEQRNFCLIKKKKKKKKKNPPLVSPPFF